MISEDTFLFFHFCFLITGVNKSSVDRLVCLDKFIEEFTPSITTFELVALKNSDIFVVVVVVALLTVEFLKSGFISSSSSSSSVPEDGASLVSF